MGKGLFVAHFEEGWRGKKENVKGEEEEFFVGCVGGEFGGANKGLKWSDPWIIGADPFESTEIKN